MYGSTIRGQIDNGVVLGEGYTSPLTITATGLIGAGNYATAALSLLASGPKAVILNQGLIDGNFDAYDGPGLKGLNGAIGLSLDGPAKLTNAGSIFGGNQATYAFYQTYGGAAGDGIDVSTAASHVSILNSGLIEAGGAGREFDGYGKTGGVGVWLGSGDHVTVTNAGTIIGVYSGAAHGYYISPAVYQGGTGISALAGGSIANSGLIRGGAGGPAYTYDNYNVRGGLGGYGLRGSGVLQIANTGTISGGAGGGFAQRDGLLGGQGGTGAYIGQSAGTPPTQANFTNAGLITGGTGGGGYGYGGYGGIGVQIFGPAGTAGTISFVNNGTITGGTGGYAHAYYEQPYENGLDGAEGGRGIQIFGAAAISNSGTISGGVGGSAGASASGPQLSQFGGAGGTGAYVGQYQGSPQQGFMSNSGLIAGGAGGGGYYGGTGGTGLYLFGTVENAGVIAGGAAGPNVYRASGGNGVKLLGGVLVNAGTIAARYSSGSAIDFAGNTLGVASTLVVDSGAVFIGAVSANYSAPDVLELAGVSKTALKGLGTQFDGFDRISFASGAKWQIEGTTGALARHEIIVGFAAGDAITITDAAAASGKVTVTKNGVVTIEDGKQTLTLDIAGAKKGEADFKFAKDTLTKTAKMAFIAPAAAPAASAAYTLAQAASVAAMAPLAAPLTTASALGFGSLKLHDYGHDKWALPVVSLTS